MSLADYKTESLDLGLVWNHCDQDEMLLKSLSVYATVRPNDLKTDGRPEFSRTSLKDLLRGWREERDSQTSETVEKELGLRNHELKVQGFELDSRILPGFRYNVRYIGKDECLFNGEARLLQSIGLGYGRRLTFKGDSLNFNDCFFWTDSSESGFAFNVEAVRPGDAFAIVDSDGQNVGFVTVEQVDDPQIEIAGKLEKNNVTKEVKVRFGCFLKRNNTHQHLINVNTQDFEVVEGIAELVKGKGCKEAVVKCIKDVFIPSLGKCTLHNER